MSATLQKATRIYLAGHTGLVGSAILRALHEAGYENLVVRDLNELDLTDQRATRRFFAAEKPEAVIVAAAKVGGILANWEQPWEFIFQNLQIEANVIGEAYAAGVRKLIFLGSSCIYPREAPQPLREEYLLTGPLEETNRAYAIAKIAGIELCRSLNREHGTDYLSLMPTNLYGPGDNYDLHTSHVLPALIRKFHEGKVAGEGSGGEAGADAGAGGREPARPVRSVGQRRAAPRVPVRRRRRSRGRLLPRARARRRRPRRHAQRGLRRGPRRSASSPRLVQRVVGYEGAVEWDASMPDGTPRKLMDVSRLRGLGWAPTVPLDEGIGRAYEWFLENRA